MRTSSITPSKKPPGAAAVGADPPRVRVADAAGDCARGDLRAVDVVAGGRAVERGRDVLPLARRPGSARVEVRREAAAERERSGGRRDGRPRASGRCRPRCRRSPTSFLRRALLHPRLERERRVVERAEAAERDVVVDAVERERAAVAAGRPASRRRSRRSCRCPTRRPRWRPIPRRTRTPRRGPACVPQAVVDAAHGGARARCCRRASNASTSSW